MGVRALAPILLVGCFACKSTQVAKTSTNPLYIDPATLDFEKNPKVRARLEESPHGYFRFINVRFSNEVCRRFADIVKNEPAYNLHGDVHLEQYAVTDRGRGLSDFDDSVRGPALLDFIRFGVSLHLASDMMGYSTEKAIDAFMSGYKKALTDPDLKVDEPKVAARERAKFSTNAMDFFKSINAMATPISDAKKAKITTALEPYILGMRERHPDQQPSYFDVVWIGRPNVGIGSALQEKYLVRMQGPTDAPDDDVIVELKHVRNLSGISCLTNEARKDPFRIIVAKPRIEYETDRMLGYVEIDQNYFWVHQWAKHYAELNIPKSFESAADLEAVAFDIGIQLGRGHPRHLGLPDETSFRKRTLAILNEHGHKLLEVCGQLTQLTVDAWKQFAAALHRPQS